MTGERGGGLRRALPAALAAVAVAVAVASAARADVGGAEAAWLTLPAGPREAALGNGGVAVADDARALWANPAGLAWNAAENIAADHAAYLGDLRIDHLAYAHPTSNRSTWAVSIARLGSGSIPRTEIADGGGPRTGLGTFEAESLLASTGFAYLLRPDLALGVSAKALRDGIDGTTGAAAAFDLGLRYSSALAGADIAVVVQNVGTAGPHGGRLPTTLRAGASWGRIVGRAHYALLCAEAAWGTDRPPSFRLGGEYWLYGLVALRAGYDESLRSEGGATLGLGVRYRRVALDYAFLPAGDLGSAHRLGLSVSFGTERERAAGRYDLAGRSEGRVPGESAGAR